jgi:hypothetical protein
MPPVRQSGDGEDHREDADKELHRYLSPLGEVNDERDQGKRDDSRNHGPRRPRTARWSITLRFCQAEIHGRS